MDPHDQNVLWLVLPVYFDSDSFLSVRRGVLEVIQGPSAAAFSSIKFIVIDDSGGADENTLSLAQLEDVDVVSVPFNVGHQRALVYGLRHLAKRTKPTDFLVTLDADGQDQPSDVPRLLEPLLREAGDLRALSLARRKRRKEGWVFKILYFCFKNLFRALTGRTVRNGNFAAYRGWLLNIIEQHPIFDLCYSSSLARLDGLDRHDIPCDRGDRVAGVSKMTYSRLAIHGLRMLMPFMDRILVRALGVFTLVFGGSLLLGSVVIGIRLGTNLAIPGWATLSLLLLLLTSFIAMGNFAIVFTLLSQSNSMSLRHIDRARETTLDTQ